MASPGFFYSLLISSKCKMLLGIGRFAEVSWFSQWWPRSKAFQFILDWVYTVQRVMYNSMTIAILIAFIMFHINRYIDSYQNTFRLQFDCSFADFRKGVSLPRLHWRVFVLLKKIFLYLRVFSTATALFKFIPFITLQFCCNISRSIVTLSFLP